MTEIHLTGRAASPGLAIGPVTVLTAAAERRTAIGDPAQEAKALKAAIGSASAELSALVEAVRGEAAEILEFQVAMLEDDALAEGAYDAISAGIPADHAWRSALDAEIAGYRSAEDEYFRARGADLVDIRDRVLAHLSGASHAAEIIKGAIVAGDDISPSAFLAADWSRGGAIVLAAGSPSSHVAMLARSRGAPMVVGLGPLSWNGRPPALALVDGDAGTVIFDPEPETRRRFEQRMEAATAARAAADAGRTKPAFTANGRRIAVLLNIAAPEDLAGLDPAICDGIGLVRTGIPVRWRLTACRTSRTQYVAYRRDSRLGRRAAGDHPHPRCRRRQADRRTDHRRREQSVPRPSRHPPVAVAARCVPPATAGAGARGAVGAPLKVMLPMVTVPSELDRVGALLDAEIAALEGRRDRLRPPAARHHGRGAGGGARAPQDSTPRSIRSAPTT